MNTLQIAARQAAIDGVASDWAELLNEAHDMARSKIRFVNLGRKIGIGIQEACGHNQIGFSFFNEIAAGLPASLNYEAARKCVKLANAMPQPAKTIEDAEAVEQLLLEASGVVDAPKRLEQHTTRDVAPATFFFKVFGELRERVSKKIATAKEWDEDTRGGVLTEINRAEKWIAELREAVQ
jgi:hypothetical protein